MIQSVRKFTPLALAFLVSMVGTAFAGDNEGATFTITELRVGPAPPGTVSAGSPTSASGVGASQVVEIDVTGDNWVSVKQVEVNVDVSSGDDIPVLQVVLGPEMPTSVAFPPGDWNVPAGGQLEGNSYRVGWALLQEGLDGALTGSATFTLRFLTGAAFTADTESPITITTISLGSSSEDRDVITVDATVTLNPPAPPVIEPNLSAVGATDVSLDFSAVGSGDAADGSDGEVTFTVAFTDNTGAGAAQDITWTVTNNGGESVFLVNGGATEIASGATETVTNSTDASGQGSATFDSEGGAVASSTSIEVSATTSAPNSDDVSRDLGPVNFSATWDVPVPAELSSFTGELTADRNVLLNWGVPSQSNNLGWEVYRSVDGTAFERVGDLIDGEGTTDTYEVYSFTDSELPLADVVHYYLKQVDLDGSAARSQEIAVALTPVAVLPTVFSLAQNFPNPFNPATTISFDLASESEVSLVIYDGAGQVVRQVIQGQTYGAGQYNAHWDGMDNSGSAVASGVYIYELRAGRFSSMEKMTLLH